MYWTQTQEVRRTSSVSPCVLGSPLLQERVSWVLRPTRIESVVCEGGCRSLENEGGVSQPWTPQNSGSLLGFFGSSGPGQRGGMT